MKKVLSIVAFLLYLHGAFANVALINPPLKASEIFLPVGKTEKLISLLDLSLIKLKDYESMTGERMKFLNRLQFKYVQRQLGKSINPDGTINIRKAEKYFTTPIDGTNGFHLGGFLLGFFGGLYLIGIIIAYLIKDDKKKNRVKWAWIGLGVVFAVISILFATGVVAFF